MDELTLNRYKSGNCVVATRYFLEYEDQGNTVTATQGRRWCLDKGYYSTWIMGQIIKGNVRVQRQTWQELTDVCLTLVKYVWMVMWRTTELSWYDLDSGAQLPADSLLIKAASWSLLLSWTPVLDLALSCFSSSSEVSRQQLGSASRLVDLTMQAWSLCWTRKIAWTTKLSSVQ